MKYVHLGYTLHPFVPCFLELGHSVGSDVLFSTLMLSAITDFYLDDV
jgi:hypothetical protein